MREQLRRVPLERLRKPLFAGIKKRHPQQSRARQNTGPQQQSGEKQNHATQGFNARLRRPQPRRLLQLGMASIAKRAISAVLATTEVNRPALFGDIGFGAHPGSFVRAVTEWLVLTQTAGTPVVGFPRFNFDGHGTFFCDFGCAHSLFLRGKRHLDKTWCGLSPTTSNTNAE
jgi:hypothetical protein